MNDEQKPFEFKTTSVQPFKKKKNIYKILFWILIVLVIIKGTILYLDLTPYHTEEYYIPQFNQTYIFGATQGIQNTVAIIVAIAKDCKEVPLVFENKTYNLWWKDGCGLAP